MRKKLRKLLFLVMILTLIGSSSVLAKAEGNVYDDASLFSDSEITQINSIIEELQEKSGWNIYAVTTSDAQGKSAMEYARDFFDTHSAEQENGVVTLIDMDNREIYLSTSGEAIRYLTDSRIDDILDRAYEDISNGNYADCMETMAAGVAGAYDAGIVNGQYNYDSETGEVSRHRSITWMEAVLAVLAAMAAGIGVFLGVMGKYRLKFGTYQYAFRDYGEVDLRVSDDRFVNQTVTHRRIPKQTDSSGSSGSSGGRSTTHSSSSGRSHGGGGRSF